MRSEPATEQQDQHPGPAEWKAGASAVVSVKFVLTAETGREKMGKLIQTGAGFYQNAHLKLLVNRIRSSFCRWRKNVN